MTTGTRMSRQDFLVVLGLERATLDVWISQRWIIPEDGVGEAGFHERDVARARLIQDLRGDLGVNDEGVDVILHLMDQLHGLRRALKDLSGAAPSTSE